jgi:hypothetical protein
LPNRLKILCAIGSFKDLPVRVRAGLAERRQIGHVGLSGGLVACLETDTAHIRSFPFFLLGPGIKYERIPIGEETVEGHHCRVEDIKIHNPKNPAVMHFRLYEAEDLQGFPIKIENRLEKAYPWVITFKDVRLGPQDPSLFLFPEECQVWTGSEKSTSGSKAKPKSKSNPPAAPTAKPQ